MIDRRRLLQAGGLGALHMGIPGIVSARGSVDGSQGAPATTKSCIFVLMCGGPSHLDSWDLKPHAPSEIRGPYQPISTSVPGMQLSELHPRLATLSDEFCLIRSMSHPGNINNHFDAMHNLLSGQTEGKPNDSPYMGAVVAKYRPSEHNVVSYAWLIRCVGPPVFCAPNIGNGGHLGPAYAPVFVGAANNHPAMPNFDPPKLYDIADPDRFAERRDLLGSLESATRTQNGIGSDWDEVRAKGFEMMTRPDGRFAYELDREPASVRDRYGMHPLGQNLLLARRLVESGVGRSR